MAITPGNATSQEQRHTESTRSQQDIGFQADRSDPPAQTFSISAVLEHGSAPRIVSTGTGGFQGKANTTENREQPPVRLLSYVSEYEDGSAVDGFGSSIGNKKGHSVKKIADVSQDDTMTVKVSRFSIDLTDAAPQIEAASSQPSV